MLFSEKNRMKVHKNQWLLTMPYPLERLAGATSRGQTMAPEGAEAFKVAMPYETPKRDVLTTYCAQSTFMGYHPQARLHTR
jgi:hypothetical protein